MANKTSPYCAFFTIFLGLFWSSNARGSRIEELCDVVGVRSNQLVGYGLVVGLANTGDIGQARFTVQSTAAMLRRLGAKIDPSMIQTRNAAAVMVTATLPPFANTGGYLDVVVSSLGNARSLAGGTLLQTPLYGANRKIYAAAQGPLVLGGFRAGGRSGSSVARNHTTTARVPRGAMIERRPDQPALDDQNLKLSLQNASFVTAQRIVQVIDTALGEGSAKALDSSTIQITPPEPLKGKLIELLAKVQLLEVEADTPARVVIDERTGTVVLGRDVRISEAAIAQGGLTVEIREAPGVSQPNAFGRGDTAVVQNSDVRAAQGEGTLHYVKKTTSLNDVVQALNALGAKPRDLIAIFQALHSVGALHAEIEVH